MPHPLFTLLAAAIVSAAMHQRPREAARMFVLCVASVVAGGWLMFLIHG